MTQTASPQELSVRNPRSGKIDYSFAPLGAAELKTKAVELRENQKAWSASGVETRIATLRRWQTALEEHRDDIVAALAIDTGRTSLASMELDGLLRSIDRWCANAPELLEGHSQAAKAMPDVEIVSDSDPYSLLGAISPWNFPLLLSFIDVIPALLAGCAALIKPSEVTPRFAVPIAKSIKAVPELAAVLSINVGDGAMGQNLIGLVDVVAFTGSVNTGKKVALAAAKAFIPCFLELGGKDPVIVLPGSDLERATTSILRGSISATGQACQSLERIYVSSGQHDEFVALLTAKAKAEKLSKDDPAHGSVGPLIFAQQAEIIATHINDAKAKGAQIQCGGQVDNVENAFWVAPTVLTSVDHSMQVMTDETFGPIMPIMAYESIEQAIELANDTVYGLSAAVFGPDNESALSVARQINAGGVSVNDSGMTSMVFETEKSAFGFSGMGPSRVGAAGITRFLRQKSLYINSGEVTPQSVFDESFSK